MLFLVFLFSSACTTRVKYFPDPARSSVTFEKVALLFVNDDEPTRTDVEKTMKELFAQTSGVPSYTLLPSGETMTLKRVKSLLRDAGCDGLLMIEAKNPDKKTHTDVHKLDDPNVVTIQQKILNDKYAMWSSGPNYHYRIETTLHSLTDDRLLFSAISKDARAVSAKPKKLVAEIAPDVKRGLKRGKLYLR